MHIKLISLVFIFSFFIFPSLICQTTIEQDLEEFKVTGVTVYRVFPFKATEEYGLQRIFYKNYSIANFSIDLPWSSPFSFKKHRQEIIVNNLEKSSSVDINSLHIYSRDNLSKNEFISFDFVDNSNYKCIIFPTIVIGIGDLTETNEYISVSEMNTRRRNFLSFFENFITQESQLSIFFQQREFLNYEPLPRESMVWTRIIRVNPNFNYLTDQQLIDFLNFRTYEYNKIVSEDYTKMSLSSSISSNYINEIVLFDGYRPSTWKIYYEYPLGLNENIVKLHTLTELNYVLLPYLIDLLDEFKVELNNLENEFILKDNKIKNFNILQRAFEAGPREIKTSGLFEKLISYKLQLTEIQHLDLSSAINTNDNLIEPIFQDQINERYYRLSEILLDDLNQYEHLENYYDNILDSAYTESALAMQTIIIFLTVITIAVTIIGSLLGPFLYNWYIYRFSTPKFSTHFKPAHHKSYKEIKQQEIKLKPNKQQLIWVMLHNNGKVIRDNWFCIIDFEKDFLPIPIEETKYKNVDFVKHYTVQKKYNVAHFNSADFSPLIPYDETIIFPVVIKTPSRKNNYNVRVTVLTGNHRNKFIHNLSIIIS